MRPIKVIQTKFGTVTICPPEREMTPADEKRLYRVILECLVVDRRPKKGRKTGLGQAVREHSDCEIHKVREEHFGTII